MEQVNVGVNGRGRAVNEEIFRIERSDLLKSSKFFFETFNAVKQVSEVIFVIN